MTIFLNSRGRGFEIYMFVYLWFVCYILTEPEEDDDDADDIYGSLAAGGAVGGPSAPSWTDLPPPSLLVKDGEPSDTSPRVSPRKTPATSPAKSSGMSSPATSPSKVRKKEVKGLNKKIK